MVSSAFMVEDTVVSATPNSIVDSMKDVNFEVEESRKSEILFAEEYEQSPTFIFDDIVGQLIESASISESDAEDVYEMLEQMAAQPLNINTCTYDQLSQLLFLSPYQLNQLLIYRDRHPLVSLNELMLVDGFRDYEIRNLSLFLYAGPSMKEERMTAHDVFRYAKHILQTKLNIVNMEHYESDPVTAQLRYQFNYDNRVRFGLDIRRNAGTEARDMRYGAYIQLDQIGVLRTFVAGNMQASFGQGLVLSNAFHAGKSMYVLNAGQTAEGIRHYGSSVNGNLHGVGATIAVPMNDKYQDLLLSAFYSLTKANDSTRRHTIGTNITYRRNRWKMGLTAVYNLWSDSLHYFNEHAAYNQNYFRGDRQAVIGLNFRYNWGRYDLFGEMATAQNQRWGYAGQLGLRMTPINDLGLILLYRYYSPTFDNTLGYGFSESSRINDENGIYLGIESRNIKQWRLSGYLDFFYFYGYKYGIAYAPSYGYDLMTEADYSINAYHTMLWRFRMREKGRKNTFSLRYQYDYNRYQWHLRTQAEGNIVRDSLHQLGYGISLYQDISYTFHKPLTLQFRIQGFYVPEWDNRIYTYEYDILHAYAVAATYGIGGRSFLNLRWRIIHHIPSAECPDPILRDLSLYCRLSTSVFTRNWANIHRDGVISDTDLHILLRAVF